MPTHSSRREFLAGIGAAAAVGAFPATLEKSGNAQSVFQLSVITDEITQDLGRALEVAANEFGVKLVELRGVWKKNILGLDEKEVAEAKRLLNRYGLKVTDIASPLFKVDWPGAPRSEYSPKTPQYGADFSYAQQDEVLERSIALADELGTRKIRCFDFWRLKDAAPFREAMDERLRDAAAKAAKKNKVLILENEFACNTATGEEAARTMRAVQNVNFQLNWDPGNAAYRGEIAYPDGYRGLPKNRIGHMHCKDVKRKPDGTYEFECMGRGIIDYAAQFRAMMRDGYRGTMSLETHWNGAGTMEESSRQSMAGMKELLKKAGAL